MRLRYLSHRRPAKAQASLCIRAVLPEPSLFAHINYGRRPKKPRHLAPLVGCACVFEEWVFGEQKVPKSHELVLFCSSGPLWLILVTTPAFHCTVLQLLNFASICNKFKLPYLNWRQDENGPRNYFLTSLYKIYVTGLGLELVTPGLKSDYWSSIRAHMSLLCYFTLLQLLH